MKSSFVMMRVQRDLARRLSELARDECRSRENYLHKLIVDHLAARNAAAKKGAP